MHAGNDRTIVAFDTNQAVELFELIHIGSASVWGNFIFKLLNGFQVIF